jgi:pimeloyl-ACP methyl ester carboxylesterase
MQLVQGRVSLWLEPLRAGNGPKLLLLHALGACGEDWPRESFASWPGPVHALDFSGHGRSGRVRGAAYYPELLVADADAALAAIGGGYVLGTGLGAYVAMFLAAARREQVPAALLLPGAGLAGFGPEPDFATRLPMPPQQISEAGAELQPMAAIDPAALAGLNSDVRPPDYVCALAASAQRLLLLEDGARRPPWWCAVRELPNALALLCGLPDAIVKLRETS